MRQEVYRVAFDEASAELSEILARFEQLRLRKDRIEKVVEALKPLVFSDEVRNLTPAPTPERSAPPVVERVVPVAEPAATPVVPVAAQPAPNSVPFPSQQTVDDAADPFSRRVENVMGMSSSSRDVREYSRLFNSGSSRGN
jgi:hypothetical protein